MNNFVYAWEGFKKNFKSAPTCTAVCDTFDFDNKLTPAHGDRAAGLDEDLFAGEKQHLQHSVKFDKKAKDPHFTGKVVDLYSLAKSLFCLQKSKKFQQAIMAKKHSCVGGCDRLFINIPSFAGGADPWKYTSKVGWKGDTVNCPQEDLPKVNQDFGDGAFLQTVGAWCFCEQYFKCLVYWCGRLASSPKSRTNRCATSSGGLCPTRSKPLWRMIHWCDIN